MHSYKPKTPCTVCGARVRHIKSHMRKHGAAPEAAYCAECDKRYLTYAILILMKKVWLHIFLNLTCPNLLVPIMHEKQHLHLPWDLEDAKQLGLVLDRYKEKYFYEVLFGVFLVYIFLQTFAIPGSIFLSILSGFLFPFYLALTLVCCCSAIGASLCFFLSNILGKKLVKKFFPERAAQWSVAVERHSNNLLNYMIFLRVTPFLPNWFINMSAPVIGVPLVPFALGTFI
ncbi:Transmembrane protein 41-like protein, partial [Operophtera brumata]